MKKLIFLMLGAWLGAALPAGAAAVKPKAVPSFCSSSIYLSAPRGSECRLSFREEGESEWKKAYTPIYDTIAREFRGSIVRLKENTPYEVKAELFTDGRKTGEGITAFRTWNSNPPIGKTYKISEFMPDADGAVVVSGIMGRQKAWIKITGDKAIEAGREGTYALKVENCRYVIFEGLTVRGGGMHGIHVKETAEDVRFVNCDVSDWGRIPVDQTKDGFYLDSEGRKINNDAGFRIERTLNTVVERCWVHDPAGLTNPWKGILKLGAFAGQKFPRAHPQGPNAVHVNQLRGGCVLRYNDFCGSQTHRYNDPVEGAQNRDIAGGFNRDADIYGNVMAFGQDDIIELDGGQCNVRVFDNRMEQTYCGVSTAPNVKGPSYIFQNVLWNPGNEYGDTGNAVKNGGGFTYSFGIQFLFSNTMLFPRGGMSSVGYGNEPSPVRGRFHAVTRNNIFCQLTPDSPDAVRYSISDKVLTPTNDFDYDMIASMKNPGGRGNILAREGSEPHGVFAAPSFTDLEKGILTLSSDDPGIDKGTAITNFVEQYTGKAPDLGAFERGASSLMPRRPIDAEADRYIVYMKEGQPEQVNIRFGKIAPTTYEVCMSDDMGPWLMVDHTSGELREGQTLTLTLRLSGRVDYDRKGMIFVRMADGLSVPISIMPAR